MLRGIIRDNGNFLVLEEYRGLWGINLSKYNLVSDDNLLRSYLWYMYSLDSPYFEVGIGSRGMVVYEYEYSNKISLGEYEDFVVRVSGFIGSFLGIFETQEERVYRELRDRIDRLIMEYSRSVIDLDKLDSEPKKVKAIGDLLGIKERLGISIVGSNRNRGNREDSIIENL